MSVVSDGRPPEQSPAAEPVAIVGMACRLPGGINTPDEFWEFLIAGKDAVGEIPPARWAAYAQRGPDHARAVRRTTARGGFLTRPQGFDAEFFGITPREAELMDPQQRIVLELAWEALEHAGIPPHTLAGRDAAVYMGVGSDDYGRRLLEDLPRIEGWTGIGASPCAVANRVSYALDLRGPSLSVDTACSSSLAAVHLGCAALRAGESGLALVGGVNVIASPGLSMVLDAAGATSPGGRSRPFDADADGYGRGEGAGVVVLKRLQDARRDGDRVLAVIRGSAVSQDGRTDGIMAPNGEAQEEVARLALRRAGVAPGTVAYVEAHGTGTRAGDPIEAAALGAVFGSGRPQDRPCLIGSVKSNIGHLEAGAGIAGVIKTVLALTHRHIPPQAGFVSPNPAVPWADAGLRVVDRRTPWPDGGHPRRAGVSAFGYGGTVAHVLLEEAPTEAPAQARTDAAAHAAAPHGTRLPAPELYPLSGASPEALRAYAGRLADAVDRGDGPAELADLRHTLWHGRTHLAHRAAVVAKDAASLRYELRKLAADQPAAATATGSAPPAEPADAVWVFSGHGAQWNGMGRTLLTAEPAFADVVDEIEPIFQDELGFSPREALLDGDHGGVDRVQALLFAVQSGLAAVWRAQGLRPAAVIGHSVGEVAAAVEAGVFTLADGARLICRRSAQVGRAAGGGAMAMVPLPFDAVRALLPDDGDVVAAIQSSPGSTVVAGTPDAVCAFSERCAHQGTPVRPVASDVAFHSPQMDPLLDGLQRALAGLAPSAPALTVYSTALDDPRSDAPRDGAYWAANLRNPVRLAAAVTAAAEDGHRLFLEVSAHPVVAHSLTETLESLGVEDAFVASSLRRDRPERATLLGSLGALHCNGCRIDLGAQGAGGSRTALPGVVWQHRDHWRDLPVDDAWRAQGHDAGSHTLLGSPVDVAGTAPLRVWRTVLDLDNRPYPGRHPVRGVEIVPAAVLLRTLLTACGEGSLSDIALLTPVTPETPREVQVLVRGGALSLVSRPYEGEHAAGAADWQTHTTALAADPPAERPDVDLTAVRGRCDRMLPPEAAVDLLRLTGIADTGFGWDTPQLSAGPGELLARVRVVDDDSGARGPARDWPAVLDAALSVAPLVFDGEPRLRIVSGLARLALDARPPEHPLVHVVTVAGARTCVDIVVTDGGGRVAGRLEGVRYTEFGAGSSGAAPGRGTLVHRMDWRPVARTARSRPLRTVVIVGDGSGAAAELARRAGTAHVRCVSLPGVEELVGVLDDLDNRDVVLVLTGGEAAGPPSPAEQAEELAWTLARAAQIIAGAGRPRLPELWLATAGLREGAGDRALTQSPLWGLGQILGGEHPEFWGGIVDLDPAAPETGAAALLDVLSGAGPAEVFAPRAGELLAARLAPVDGAPERAPLGCRPDATYLITGGLGVLGRHVADWLVSRGARRLVLAGRTALPPRSTWDTVTDPAQCERIAAVRTLEARGATVRTVAVDVADAGKLAAALDTDALGLPPVRGVVHAAGVLDNRLVGGLTRDSLHAVMRPKAFGALVLDQLFPPGSVDFIVLFSSVGQLLGLAGQASYAAANGFLDGLARRRSAAGHDDMLSLCWTSWHGAGMAVNEVVDEELRNVGVSDISVEEAFLAWDRASRHRHPQVAVFRPLPDAEGTARLPVLSELDFGAAPAGSAAAPDDIATTLAAATAQERRAWMLGEVAGQVAAETRTEAEHLDVRRPLTALGVDSVITLAIRNRLEKRLGLSLPATLLWQLPTVSAISDHLLDLLVPPQDAESPREAGAPTADSGR
ncbi:type I polyketide synthase [Streptomyces humidus]|uniref:type I polyketide synthase n=1 Tax=Streptomyces humidus TaxID=52259 RepID=UPI001E416324|nr:type I polyketide synthase [Streptomyces humidus]